MATEGKRRQNDLNTPSPKSFSSSRSLEMVWSVGPTRARKSNTTVYILSVKIRRPRPSEERKTNTPKNCFNTKSTADLNSRPTRKKTDCVNQPSQFYLS